MKDSLHTLLYATILGGVCALVLTAAAQWTEPHRKRNDEAERNRHVHRVLAVPFEKKASAQELVEVFKKNIREQPLGELTAYAYVRDGAPAAAAPLAVPFSGQGLWGPIKGFLALEPDRETIRGITFHEQEETPGLGGEIAASWFCGRFKGKRIHAAGVPGIRLVREGANSANEIDAVTGATMTCEKVQAMLNATIKRIMKERSSDGG